MEVMENFIMRPYRAWVTKALIFFSVIVLVGCSAARMGYKHGETLSYWWLNSYVSFESEQQAWARKRIDALFAWHHKTQLKDYVQLLAGAQKRVQHNVTQAELLLDFDEVKKRMGLLSDKALPDLADLALGLRPQQIAHLERKYASNSETFRDNYVRGDTEQRQRYRFKKVMQVAEYWFGNFSRDQEAQIRTASDARPLNNALLLADKVQRQKDLLALLRKIQSEKPSHDAVVAMLKEHIDNAYFDRSRLSPEQKTFFDASREGAAHLAMVIINLTTAEQKAHAVKRAQQWIDDFNQLAAGAS